MEKNNQENDVLYNLTKKIPERIYICFFVGMASGLLTHMYMLTNKLPIWDDLYMFDTNGMGSLVGRWLLVHIDWFSGDYSSSWINAFLLILFMSVSACLILSTLELKSRTSAILVPIMILTFPSTTSTICHMYTADSFAFAIMMASLSVYLWRKYKYGFIAAVVPLILSLGCYQAYLCLAATIMIATLILDVLRTKEDNSKEVFFAGLKGVGTLGAGAYIYIALSHMFYPNLGEYGGINEMGKLDLKQLPYNIAIAYKRLLDYFVINPKSFVNTEMRIFNLLAVIIAVGVTIFWIVKKEIYKNVRKLLLTLFLGIVFPLAMSAIYVIASGANISVIMLLPYVFVYILAIAVLELFDGGKKYSLYVSVITLVVIAGVAHSNFVLTNQAYLRMNVAFDRVSALYNRMGARVEGCEEFELGDRFTVIGDFYNPKMYNGNLLSDEYRMDDDRYQDFSGVALENGLMTSGTRGWFCKIYLGLPYEVLDDEQVEKIKENEEFQSMTIYPSEGSIKKIGDLWVVRYPDN